MEEEMATNAENIERIVNVYTMLRAIKADNKGTDNITLDRAIERYELILDALGVHTAKLTTY